MFSCNSPTAKAKISEASQTIVESDPLFLQTQAGIFPAIICKNSHILITRIGKEPEGQPLN